MNQDDAAAERLIFLARVVRKECGHLQATDARLFNEPFVPTSVVRMETDAALAERVDAFVSRFGRLQDTLGDKLLPALLALLGERTKVFVDNLDKAERLGWVDSVNDWLAMRQLRNQMVHEYIEDPEILVNALNAGHAFVPALLSAADRMTGEITRRIEIGSA
ncbi:MAG: hypothetical protein EPN21_09575 [Methylococcaceae bacterium]|nr:MAG: hypothetical protein EPN21_09575 [Methylococcaceae bacterium]